MRLNKWIDVNERLPEHEEGECVEVIAYVKNARCATALYYRDGDFLDEDSNHYNVTHWMPMPEPPKPQ